MAGRHSIIAGAPGDNPISLLRSEYFLDDEDATILVGFGSDHNAIDLQDVDSARKALNVWRTICSTAAATTGWPTSGRGRPGRRCGRDSSSTDGATFLSSDSRLRFAGADYARGWNGVVVDGGHRVRDCHRDVVDQGVC
ncbi:hypothetical protein [Williamsia muralis]|uniref:hypothetical protein n=1 Tax=Williamsia marianensis TaxID=85044 RepID=UPI001CB95336|nr:hypothetical protein [Williamsia marianensis]